MVLLLAGCGGAAPDKQIVFVDLFAPNTFGGNALSVSNGTEVGFISTPQSLYSEGAIWTGSAASFATLVPPGNVSGNAVGISGQYIAVQGDTSGYLYDQATKSFSALGVSGSWSYCNGLDGDSVVGYTTLQPSPSPQNAALWKGNAGSYINLNPSADFGSSALAVQGNTQVGYVVQPYLNFSIERACLWRGSAGSFVNLDPNSQEPSVAYGVYGDVEVGFKGQFTPRAGFWTGTAASFVNLDPDLGASIAYGVWGNYAVGFYLSDAVIWNLHTKSFINLPAPGIWASSRAYSITRTSAGYDVVGYVQNADDTTSHPALWHVPVSALP